MTGLKYNQLNAQYAAHRSNTKQSLNSAYLVLEDSLQKFVNQDKQKHDQGNHDLSNLGS